MILIIIRKIYPAAEPDALVDIVLVGVSSRSIKCRTEAVPITKDTGKKTITATP